VLNKLAELSFYRWQDKPPEDAKSTKRGLLGARTSQKVGVR
jgi:hypothetical protein